MRVDRKVFVPMRDGIKIALTTYLPEGAGRFPVVVESVPYRKDDDCYARDWQNYIYLAERGIAGVRIDIRGSGASEGIITDEYTAAEMADTVEILDWAANQSWSNGNVGMWGISWGGFSSLQTAMLQPEPLKAIMPVHATHDRFATDVHYAGGSVLAAEQGDWPASMVALNGLPPDPAIVGDRWRAMWMERLEHTPQWLFEWFRHQYRDAYWLHGSPCADYESIEVPTLLIGGWLDGYVDGMLALFENLRCPRKAVIGPWGHYRPATGVPAPTFDHLDLMARWFGHHLRGDDNGVMDMPDLISWIRTAPPYDRETTIGYWRGDAQWFPTEPWAMRLPGEEDERWQGLQWVGSHAPAWDRAAIGSTDPSPDDTESLLFESEPLTEDLVILGQPRAELMVASDRAVGLAAVRLFLVSPAGDSHLLCRGNKNLAFPQDLSEPEPIEPGAFRLVEVPLLAASVVIPAGWRIRLAISGADFPVLWPPGERFTLSIKPASSRLVLPLLTAAGEILDIPPSPPPPDSPVDVIDSTFNFKVTRREGQATFEKIVGRRERQPDGLLYDSMQTFSVTVADDDPGTTVVEAATAIKLRRGEWQVGTDTTMRVTTDDSHFRIDIHLLTRDHDEADFSREWSETIRRQWA
ncbi:MAG: CocE/NonD family hydrolase [Actinobacteria bacterium]|nr:CocE/NonD family hydrolase [Actinomycetota bacterium]